MDLVKLIICPVMRIAVIQHIPLPITQSHITGLNVATVACQHRVDRCKRLLDSCSAVQSELGEGK